VSRRRPRSLPPIDEEERGQVRELLTTELAPQQPLVSCIAAALREARTIVGRDVASETLIDRTPAAAIVPP